MRSGAHQWRVPCEHLDDRPSERAMHSEVSRNNLSFFVSERRVTEDVDEDDLRQWLDRAEAIDGALVFCNHCKRGKIVAEGLEVVHEGGVRE